VFFGLRKRSGMIDCEGCGSSDVASMSKEERLRCRVRALAAARSAGGVRYGSGKDWILLKRGRVDVV